MNHSWYKLDSKSGNLFHSVPCPIFFSVLIFPEIESFSLSTHTDFSVRLFFLIYSRLFLNIPLIHPCTVTKLPPHNIHCCFFLLPWIEIKLHPIFQDLRSSTLPHFYCVVLFPQCACCATRWSSVERCPAPHWSDQLWNWKWCSCFPVVLRLGSQSCFSVQLLVLHRFSVPWAGHALHEFGASLRCSPVSVLR